MQNFLWINMAVVLLCGTALGAGLLLLWQQRGAKQALRMPQKWPLRSRPLLTIEEKQVFDWLKGVFPDHFVMCKLPVLRFTVPVKKERKGLARRWQELLHGVYCTFTVCTKDGFVIGCVDVHGKRGLSDISRELKERLLEDCAVTYFAVRPNALPNAGVVRSAFLGEPLLKSASEQVTRGGDSIFNHELVTFADQKRQAAHKELKAAYPAAAELSKNHDPDGTGAFAARRAGRSKPVFDESFLAPLDSRPGRLG